MNCMHTIRLVAALSLGLLPLAAAAQSARPGAALQTAIDQHEKNLAQARAQKNQHTVVTELNVLGALYRLSGQLQKALTYLNEALPIEQKYSSMLGEATTRDTIGRIDTDLGLEDQALAQFNAALPLWRALASKTGEASTLSYTGKVYNQLGNRDEALKYLNEAMVIWHAIDNPQAGDNAQGAPTNLEMARTQQNPAIAGFMSVANRDGEAGTLDNLGRTYSDMGDGNKALEYFNQALPLFRSANQGSGEALLLNDIGLAYALIGQKQKALESYNRAIAIWRQLGSRQGEALTLNYIGWFYRDLSQNQTALDYYNQALPIWREVGNRTGEARALSDIGRAYADLGQPQKALDYANQALPIFRETGSRRGEAMTLNTMGRDYSDMGHGKQAFDLDLQALAIWREVKDQRNEAIALMTLAWAYSLMKQPELSFTSAAAALGLARATGNREAEGAIEASMMLGFRNQSRPEEAIFFGLEAVNSYEQVRRNLTGLDKEIQAGYAQSRAAYYRMLAELLVEAGRLGQAEQILDLLKEQELKDLVAGATAGADAGIEPLKLSPAQMEAETELPDIEKKARMIEESSLAYAQIEAKPQRTPDDEAQLKTLEATMQQTGSEIESILNGKIFPELDAQSAPGKATAESAKSLLQDSLAKLGPRVMGIRLLLGEDHAYAIVVTADSRKKFVLQATPADIRSRTFDALKALGTPTSDPRPQLTELYSMIVAPLADELKALEAAPGAQGSVPTLLWSLDDALRYVPMGALYDGNHYLIERFHNVLFTPESYGHMTDSPIQNGNPPSVLAMGLSKSYGGLPALPGVMPELDAVVHDPSAPESHGPMDGKLLPNEQFTLAALKRELGTGKGFPVVHIASHFVLVAGSGDEPFLMMGGENMGDANGFEWNLSDMENSPVAFHGTRLLTLSACSTAKDYKSRNGLEMDSLGMVAQQKDAEAVLATLWDVNDLSTSRIMSDFYSRWVKDPADGKAEALRQAQLAFLHGATPASNGATPGGGSGRGFETVGQQQQPGSLGYAHPYYWAPFVLIGNFQ